MTAMRFDDILLDVDKELPDGVTIKSVMIERDKDMFVYLSDGSAKGPFLLSGFPNPNFPRLGMAALTPSKPVPK